MTLQILASLLAALALGVALLLFGLRGRRVDRSPVCRGCGFDLTGVLPDGKTCPECGSGLARPKAVRVGRRRRLWTFAAVGAVLAVAPALMLGLGAYAALTGDGLARHMPVGVLVAQARHGDAEAVGEAGTELVARLSAERLSKSQRAAIIGAILEIQGDPDAPWDESLGDFVELARAGQRVSDEDYQRFLDQAVLLGLILRPAIAQGDPFPIGIEEIAHRAGSISTISVSISIVSAEAAGIPLDIEPGPVADSMARTGRTRQDLGTASIWGSASGVAPHALQTRTAVRLPASPLPVGEAPCTVVVARQAQLAAIGRGLVWKGDTDPRTTTLTATARIVAPEQRLLSVVETTDDLRLEMIRNLPARCIANFERDDRGPSRAMITFSINRIPAGLAHTVSVRDSLGVHELQSHIAVTGGSAAIATPYRSRGLTLFRDLSPEQTVDLILRPDPDLALRTLDVFEVYGGELEIKGVRVEKP